MDMRESYREIIISNIHIQVFDLFRKKNLRMFFEYEAMNKKTFYELKQIDRDFRI